MKRYAKISVLAAIAMFTLMATNCSSPLESIDDPLKNPPILIHDTVFVLDTIFLDTSVADTVFQSDTIFLQDSVFVTDTLVQIDTVFMVDTIVVDTCETLSFCDILNSSQHEIVWLFRNAAGLYRLEFSGFVEKTRPPKEITIFVGDKSYIWFPIDNMELIFEQELDENVIVKISPLPPESFGHDLHVCLTLVPL